MNSIKSIFTHSKPETAKFNYETLDESLVLSSEDPFFNYFLRILNDHEKINFEVNDNKLSSVNSNNDYKLIVEPAYKEGNQVILSLDQAFNSPKSRCVFNLHDKSSRIEMYKGDKFHSTDVIGSIGINPGYGRYFMDLNPELGDISGNGHKHIDRIVETYFNGMKE